MFLIKVLYSKASALVPSVSHVTLRKTAVGSDSKISVIIPTRDRVEFLEACLESLGLGLTDQNLEVIVIDNQSVQKSTLDYLQAQSDLRRIKVIPFNEKFNFSRIVNFAVKQARHDLVLVLNNDATLLTGLWLDSITTALADPKVGAIGAVQFSSSGELRENGVSFFRCGLASGMNTSIFESDVYSVVPAASFAAAAFRREVFNQIGGLDEFFSEGLNDLDFCVRLRIAGLHIVTNREFAIVHNEYGSRDRVSSFPGFIKASAATIRFAWKWGYLVSTLNEISVNPSPEVRKK